MLKYTLLSSLSYICVLVAFYFVMNHDKQQLHIKHSSKSETLAQYCFSDCPTSAALAQHQMSIKSTSRVYRNGNDVHGFCHYCYWE